MKALASIVDYILKLSQQLEVSQARRRLHGRQVSLELLAFARLEQGGDHHSQASPPSAWCWEVAPN
jgi:hypothetical protein